LSDFTVYPAIDLRNGQVVRLRQGDPSCQTVYSEDPAQIAEQWAAEGAHWVHVVNLDGAFGETAPENRKALQGIVGACGKRVRIQFGGGIRQIEDITLAIDAGVSRVVIGTAAIENPAFVAHALGRFGQQVAFALDAVGNRLMTHGWKKTASQSVSEFGDYLAYCGAATVIYTNISRDGMGTGVDWFKAKELARQTGLEVIASGGVVSLDDVRMVRENDLSGIVIGRALYENLFTLDEALSC
jgi:phosphoribosylformimino-5-aminoimidazole carboxamide ribotide isomerase